ncbi:regulatory protein RecX [Desulfitobacterium sp.]|uniref:regulatory protein RecX n=1 Tax=Desulfitobacterium sp. TaxID=49981 RepID=UPI002B203DC9|nr:RecX family transcriptional regulator [Desulfitobacterium sp.]MEA4901256.1 RecX family transcriptional regulator [Desulfitobacterium sp.]
MKNKIISQRSALDAALTYLSRRALTRYELISRLERKGYSEAEIIETIERVEGWGYINDRNVALSFAQTKLASYSQKRVNQELLRRGIAPELVKEVLQDLYEPERELDQCTNLAKKMWSEESRRWDKTYQYKKTYAYIPREVFLKQKIGQKLMIKGYPQQVIRQALEESSGWN